MILWGFFKRYGWYYLVGFVFLIFNSALDMLPARILGDVFDLMNLSPIDNAVILRQLILMVIIAASIFATRSIWRSCINGNARRLEMWLRETLFSHLQTLGPAYYNQQKTGDLIAYGINDVNAIRQTFGPGLALAGMSLFTGGFSIYNMVTHIDARLALICLAPIPLLLIAILLLGKQTRVRFSKVQETFAAVSGRVQENISGIRVIKAYAQEDKETARFEKLNERMRKVNVDMVKISSAMVPLVAFTFGISFTACLIYGSALVRAEAITLGDFITFNGYLMLIIHPVQAVARVTNMLQRGMASLKRFSSVIGTKPDVVEPVKNLHTGALRAELEIHNLTFTYPDASTPALSEINVSLAPGKTLGILGCTGSGKTTLCNLLMHLYNPPRDTVFFDGVDILDIGLATLREGIGYVPQDNFLFSSTVRENIRFFAPNVDEEAIVNAARSADVLDSIRDFPAGFDTEVGERGMTLSGGQKQRISIARALVKRPALLVMDDALSAVDAQTELVIQRSIAQYLSGGASGLLVAHRISTLMNCDEIIVLDGGRIIQRGTHEQLIAQDGYYAQTAQAQLAVEVDS